MKPSESSVIEQPGYSVLTLSLATIISNVLTVHIAGNHRSAHRPAFKAETHVKLIELATRPDAAWLTSDENAANSAQRFDYRRKLDQLHSVIKDYIDVLVDSNSTFTADYGACVGADLVSAGVCSVEHVVMPSLGYPRDYYAMRQSETPDVSGACRLPSPVTPWARAIALACAICDNGRITSDIIPLNDAGVGHFKPTNQPWGTLLTTKEQIRAIQRLYFLYSIQGTLLSLHANWRYHLATWELAYGRDKKAHVALITWREQAEWLLSLPIHPLLSYVTSALLTGDVYTFDGKRPALYRTQPRVPVEKKKGVDCGPGLSELQALIIHEAVADYSSATDCGRDTNAQAHPLTWGQATAELPSLSVGQTFYMLQSTGKLVDKVSQTKTTLHWEPVSAQVGDIRADGADFVLTDGLGYSAPPASVVLGLRPCLSLGNPICTGFKRRLDPSFNVASPLAATSTTIAAKKKGKTDAADEHQPGGQILYSPVVMRGHLSATGSSIKYERNWIAAGMWMGEPDVMNALMATATADPVGLKVVKHYSELISSYVQQFYTALHVKVAPDTRAARVIQTDWDITGYGAPLEVLKAAWVHAIADTGDKSSELRLLFRAEGFSVRAVVRFARAHEVEQYDAFGNFEAMEPFDGGLDYNNVINLAATMADVDKLVELAPIVTNAVTPALATVLTTEPALNA